MKPFESKTVLKSPRRRYPALEKCSIVNQTYEAGRTVSSVAREHGIAPSQLYQWRKAMEMGAQNGVDSEEGVVSVKEVKKLQARIKELEAALGRKSLDNEILKEAVKVGREKKLISRQPLVGLADFE